CFGPGLLVGARWLGSPPLASRAEAILVARASSACRLKPCCFRAAARPRRLPPPIQPEPLPPASAAQLKVGLLLPLSGTNAELGKAMLDAAQLALFAAS